MLGFEKASKFLESAGRLGGGVTTYLFGTGFFMRANQLDGFDLRPGFWDRIDREHAAGRAMRAAGW